MRPTPRPRPTHARGLALPWLLALLVFAGALAALPLGVTNPYLLHVMILIFLAVVQGESWNVIGGYTGQYSVGHSAFFGIGGYAALLLVAHHAPLWWGFLVPMAAAVAVGIVTGSITFRLRGPYFVLASIAVAEILRLAALNWKEVTNGAEGMLLSDVPALRIAGWTITDWSTKAPFYYAALVLAGITIAVNWGVQHSKLGYYFQAIREDQDAAHSLGIPLTRYKNVALAISAFFTACSGAFYALYVGFVDPPTVLSVEVSVQFVLVCIIGGIGTIGGPVVGALVLIPLSEALRANILSDLLFRLGVVREGSPAGAFLKENLAHAHALIYGILVVIVILFMPDGVLGFVRQRLRRRAPAAAPSGPAAGGVA